MGWRFRKSFSCGLGFRINISKSGVGYSWGAPGYRITHEANGGIRKTYSIPGSGLSYVEEELKRTNNNTPLPRANSMERYNLEHSTSYNVNNGQIKDMSSPENKALVNTLKKIKVRNFITWCIFGLIVTLSTMFTKLSIVWLGVALFYGISLSFLLLTIFLNNRRFVFLDYTIDKESENYISKRNSAFKCLESSSKLWAITSYQNVAYSRVNAGCHTNIERKSINFQYKKLPSCIKTNQNFMFYQLTIGTSKYIFLPDKIIVLGFLNVGAISYCDINITLEPINFVETEVRPIDALFLYYTWLYVNNNGTPDRRFNNNRQIPVYRYTKIFIKSNNGLNLHLMSSSESKSEDFKKIYDSLN